jgi:hypothetical protein
MSSIEDFFSLDDYVNIIFKISKKANKLGGFFFEVFLFDDSPEESDSDECELITLGTRWKYLDWDSKKNILDSSKIFDPIRSEVSYDPILYKDNLIKNCLVEWKFHDIDKEYSKVNQSKVNELPAGVVEKLLYFYEKAIEDEEERLGKV